MNFGGRKKGTPNKRIFDRLFLPPINLFNRVYI
jgi:hypothetical protein